MSVSLAYLQALKVYLDLAYQTEPPANGTIGTLKIGLYQADPEGNPAVITLHTHNPFDESYADVHWQYIKNQDSHGAGADQGYQVMGGQREMGGGGLYDYWWWLKLDYYMTRTGATQTEAWVDNDTLVSWLVNQIGAAQPGILGMGEVDGAQLISTWVISVVNREGGGTPSSYIWKTLIKIQGVVYRPT